jgi:hypothetical protein
MLWRTNPCWESKHSDAPTVAVVWVSDGESGHRNGRPRCRHHHEHRFDIAVGMIARREYPAAAIGLHGITAVRQWKARSARVTDPEAEPNTG